MPINSHTTIKPSIPYLLKSCKTLLHLQQLHAHIIRKGLQQDHFIISHFLSLSTSLSYSTSIFSSLISPSIFLFNVFLKVLTQRRRSEDTLLLFLRMKRSGLASPDKYTYPCVIKSCSLDFRLKEGEVVHGSAFRFGVVGDVYVASSLIDLYGKCGDIGNARKVFDEMSVRNVVSWTALVAGYVNAGDLGSAKWVFDRMPERNSASWNAMIGGLVKAGDLFSAKKLFDQMPERDAVSFTVMIDGYAKSGDMASAKALFEAAPNRDIVTWSALISGYAQNGQPSQAINTFMRMEVENVKPDEYVMVSLMSACSQLSNLDLARWVDSYLGQSLIDISQQHVLAALIDMNAKCGNMDRAIKLFEDMPKRDVITYCSMIQGLSDHGYINQALDLFNRMLDEGVVPDEVAFTVILTACGRGGLVEEGWYYFVTLRDKFSVVPSPDHYACAVDLLSRAGNLKAAYDLLKSMPVEPHACAWGALLGACKLHCNVELGQIVAQRLFELEPRNAGNYVILSNIYAAAENWLDVSLLREKMKERGISKIPGRSWV